MTRMPRTSAKPRSVLSPRTNVPDLSTPPKKSSVTFPTPPDSNPTKRRRTGAADAQKAAKKRKVAQEPAGPEESEESDIDYEIDEEVSPGLTLKSWSASKPRWYLPSRNLAAIPGPSGVSSSSTWPILQSYVSSHKADTFRCQSIGEASYLTPPYTCLYSHSAKHGGKAHLAVATEEGTVHILDTTKRQDWDPEQQRATFQPHNNGIFDIAWSADDTLLATCSGDQSTRILDVETGVIRNVLRGHSSTVKCMAWDPTNNSLVSTGGRDGAICLWDLRIGELHHVEEEKFSLSAPVMTIPRAHEDTPVPRRGKQNPAPRTVTDLLYPEAHTYGLISSSSFDGVLRYWDLRAPSTPKRKTNALKSSTPTELFSSASDPTTLHGSRRPRGITSMAAGSGPSSGVIFAVGADSRIHTYDLQTLTPQHNSYHHDHLQTNSFYIGASVSPCGRWLACGGSGTQGSNFVFNVENAARPWLPTESGIELRGQKGEVGAVDWAKDMLAACTDDGTVRIWRPDIATYRRCLDDPEQAKWDWSWSS